MSSIRTVADDREEVGAVNQAGCQIRKRRGMGKVATDKLDTGIYIYIKVDTGQ